MERYGNYRSKSASSYVKKDSSYCMKINLNNINFAKLNENVELQ